MPCGEDKLDWLWFLGDLFYAIFSGGVKVKRR